MFTFISGALLLHNKVVFATLDEYGVWKTLSGVTVPVTPETLVVTQRRANALLHRHGGRKNGSIFHVSATGMAALKKTALPVDEYIAFRRAREAMEEDGQQRQQVA